MSVAIKIGRRLLFKRAIGAVGAASVMSKVNTESLPPYDKDDCCPEPVVEYSDSKPVDPLWEAASELAGEINARQHQRHNLTAEYQDTDVVVMKSWSHAFKVHVTRKRREDESRVMKALRRDQAFRKRILKELGII